MIQSVIEYIVSFFICSDLETQEGAKILGKCNERIFFRKSPSVVPRWGKECLLSTICTFAIFKVNYNYHKCMFFTCIIHLDDCVLKPHLIGKVSILKISHPPLALPINGVYLYYS